VGNNPLTFVDLLGTEKNFSHPSDLDRMTMEQLYKAGLFTNDEHGNIEIFKSQGIIAHGNVYPTTQELMEQAVEASIAILAIHAQGAAAASAVNPAVKIISGKAAADAVKGGPAAYKSLANLVGKEKGTFLEPAPGYRTAPGEVLGEIPAAKMPPTNTAQSGLALESEMRAILEQRFPNTQFRYLKSAGPDVEWTGGKDPGFDIGDFKPDTVAKHYEAIKQFRSWGAEGWNGRVAPKTFRAATMAYQPDGTLYVRDVGIVNPEGL
jgi:hypothetical protein